MNEELGIEDDVANDELGILLGSGRVQRRPRNSNCLDNSALRSLDYSLLDVPQVDPDAADLDLGVVTNPALDDKRSVGQEAAPVSRAEHGRPSLTFILLSGEGILNKRPGGEDRVAQF